MKLDLHVHSNHSVDSISKPETILKTAKKLGIVVAITDHDSTSIWPIFKMLSKEMNWPIIFGEEIKVIENKKCVGEIVGLFMQKEVRPGTKEEIFENLHSQGALAMVVHPFDVFRNAFENLNSIVKKTDLLEVFNARSILNSHNKAAKKFATANNLPQTANSDSHSPVEIGASFSEVDAQTLEEARKELIKGNTQLFEKKSPIRVHLITQLAKYNLIKDR